MLGLQRSRSLFTGRIRSSLGTPSFIRSIYTEKQLDHDLMDNLQGKNAKNPEHGATPDETGDILHEAGNKYVRGIVLNRPDSLNALTLSMVKEITRKVKALEVNPSVKAIYLTDSSSTYTIRSPREMNRSNFGNLRGNRHRRPGV